jgi:hypothetical protein
MNMVRILKRAGAGGLAGAIAILYLISVVGCVTPARKPVPQPITPKKQTRIPSPPKKPKQEKRKLPSIVLIQNQSGRPVLVKLSGPIAHVAYIQPQGYARFKTSPGDYHVRIRSGKTEPYDFAGHEPFTLKQLGAVPIQVAPPEQRAPQWHKIDEADFYGSKPRLAVITGRMVDVNAEPIVNEQVCLAPYKNGKAGIGVGEFGVLLNPCTTIKKEDDGRFRLILNLDAFPHHDQFILQRGSLNGPPMKTNEGTLIVLSFSKEPKMPIDIGIVTAK